MEVQGEMNKDAHDSQHKYIHTDTHRLKQKHTHVRTQCRNMTQNQTHKHAHECVLYLLLCSLVHVVSLFSVLLLGHCLCLPVFVTNCDNVVWL